MIKLIKEIREEVIEFTQEMMRIPSFTGEEGELANVILKKLEYSPEWTPRRGADWQY